jgi:hypothetical protein
MFRKQNLAAISHPQLLEGSSGPIRMNRIIRETTAGKFSHDNPWLRASGVTTLGNEYKRLGIYNIFLSVYGLWRERERGGTCNMLLELSCVHPVISQ